MDDRADIVDDDGETEGPEAPPPGVPFWLHFPRRLPSVLLNIVRPRRSPVLAGVDVGGHYSQLAAVLLYHLPQLHMTTIRPGGLAYMARNFHPEGEDDQHLNPLHRQMVLAECRANALFAADRHRIALDDPHLVSKQISDRSLDFVFIDANHSEEAIRHNIQTWLPKVASGGILCGDDWCDEPNGRYLDVRSVWNVSEAVPAALEGHRPRLETFGFWWIAVRHRVSGRLNRKRGRA